MTADDLPEHIRKGGHLAAVLDYALRRVLYAGLEGDERQQALELLRDACPDPPEDWDPRPYIASQEWVFAKTMPERPHEYVHLSKSTDWRGHLLMNRWLRVTGELEKFVRPGVAVPEEVEGWRYWAGADPNWTIVNRRVAPVALGATDVPLPLGLVWEAS